jgi:dephospho-CoA kinase
MNIVGLAGRPGCGKSAAARELAQGAGVVWLDLDKAAWETYRPRTPTYWRLLTRFGAGIVSNDGRIDRARLGHIVFSDVQALDDLNAIVHPAVTNWLRGRIATERRRGTRLLLVEGALLASSPHVDRSLFDAILWLDADSATRSARLRERARPEQADRFVPTPEDDAIVWIDASGSLAQTVDAIQRILTALREE